MVHGPMEGPYSRLYLVSRNHILPLDGYHIVSDKPILVSETNLVSYPTTIVAMGTLRRASGRHRQAAIVVECGTQKRSDENLSSSDTSQVGRTII